MRMHDSARDDGRRSQQPEIPGTAGCLDPNKIFKGCMNYFLFVLNKLNLSLWIPFNTLVLNFNKLSPGHFKETARAAPSFQRPAAFDAFLDPQSVSFAPRTVVQKAHK